MSCGSPGRSEWFFQAPAIPRRKNRKHDPAAKSDVMRPVPAGAGKNTRNVAVARRLSVRKFLEMPFTSVKSSAYN
jgi:hypothetical protein